MQTAAQKWGITLGKRKQTRYRLNAVVGMGLLAGVILLSSGCSGNLWSLNENIQELEAEIDENIDQLEEIASNTMDWEGDWDDWYDWDNWDDDWDNWDNDNNDYYDGGYEADSLGGAKKAEDVSNISYSKEFSNVKTLELHSYWSNVSIVEGDSFRVEAKRLPEDYPIKLQNGTLSMGRKWYERLSNSRKRACQKLKKNERPELTISIPKGYVLEEAVVDVSGVKIEGMSANQFYLDTGSLASTVSKLTTKGAYLDTGSGSVAVDGKITGDLEIDSGTGKVKLRSSGKIDDLYIDSGSGTLDVDASVNGEIVIDSGSGSVKINSQGQPEDISIDSGSGSVYLICGGRVKDYSIDADMGSGSLIINEKKQKNGEAGTGTLYELEVDGGSGDVVILFQGK